MATHTAAVLLLTVMLVCCSSVHQAGSAPPVADTSPGSSADLPPETVVVDLSSDEGPVTYRASGFLHGMSAEQPPDQLVAPLKPKLFRDWADGRAGVFATNRRVRRLGATQQLSVCDSWGDRYGFTRSQHWPGDGGDWREWENLVADLVTRTKGQGCVVEWDIWNEPDTDTFWGRDRAQWLEAWRRGYLKIREFDPHAVIVGPSLASYDRQVLLDFLTYAKAHNVLPDVLSWHEFGWDEQNGARQIAEHTAEMRALMAERGINMERISLNEIIGPDCQLRPGPTVAFFAAVEAARVDSACHACWDEATGEISNCDNISLDGLLTPTYKEPRATWWAYKSYADMTGQLVAVTRSASVDGLAAFDGAIPSAVILLGRQGAGTTPVTLRIEHLPAALSPGSSGKVRVRVEHLPDLEWRALPEPIVVSDGSMEAGLRALDVRIESFAPGDAYVIRLSGAAATP